MRSPANGRASEPSRSRRWGPGPGRSGGCEGFLRFGPEMIVFESEHQEDSRSWRRDTELSGVWSSGRYNLDIVVREREGGSFSGEKRFRFQLKEPLDEDFYFRIRRDLLP